MMMGSRVNLDSQTAVVLHHLPYKNNSLIIHFFLPELGKVSAIAKGIRQSKKNEMSYIQPFQELRVSMQGQGDLLFYRGIDAVIKSWKLKGKGLYCAYYLNELLLRLLPGHTDCRDIYFLYTQSLDLLYQPQHPDIIQDTESAVVDDHASLEIPLRYFELKLLEFLGYGLNLVIDIDTGEMIAADERYYFDIHAGPSLKQELPHSASNLIPLSGQTLINMSRLKFDHVQTLQESKQLLKCALSTLLGPKPLKSRDMFRQLFC